MGALEKAITTQEELDAIISDRLKRKEKQIEEKYADYNSLKEKSEKYDTDIEALKTKLSEANNSASTANATIAELTNKVKGYERDSEKMKIAHECGIPYELAGRLTGDDEQALREDALKIKGLLGGGAPPLRSGENGGASGIDAAYKTLAKNLNGDD